MAKVGKVWTNNKRFVDDKDHLSFDKLLTPKLVIYEDDCKFVFTSPAGKTKTGEFHPNTSEYKILMFLIKNLHTPFETAELIPQLKKKRSHAEGDNENQRVLDTISAIRNKLGKEVLKTTPKGYKVVSEITWI